jgi:hypothetical protein
MNWKDFFKPSWKKIILTVIIGLLTLSLMFFGICWIPSGNRVQPKNFGLEEQCPPIHPISVVVNSITAFPLYLTEDGVLWSITNFDKNLPTVLIETIGGAGFNFRGFLSTILRTLIITFYWYFLSCLIVSIYNKTKKKKIHSEEKFI